MNQQKDIRGKPSVSIVFLFTVEKKSVCVCVGFNTVNFVTILVSRVLR